jgi:tetratricopeptide (TPR) repeat protein
MRILSLFITLYLFASCGGKTIENKGATQNLDSLVQVYPDSLPLLIEYSDFLLKELRTTESLPMAAKAFRLDSTNLHVRFLYASSLVNRVERSTADVEIAQKHLIYITKKEPANKEALMDLATTYTIQSEFDKSFKTLNEILRIDKKYRDAYTMKGMNYRALGNYKLAKSSFETAVQQDSEFFMGYLQLGWLYSETEDYKNALEYFKTATTLEPTSTDALYGVAYSLQATEKYPEAMKEYRHLVEVDNNYYLAFFNQGYIKQFHQSQPDSALFFYKAAIELQPDFVKAHHNMGVTYLGLGDKGEAYYAFKRALKYNPEYELSKVAILKCK